MAKQRNRAADYLVCLALQVVIAVLQALTVAQCQALARGLACLLFRVDRRHREVALDNLRRAWPGRYRDDELERLVRAVYDHFCLMVMEMVHLPRKLHPNNWRQYIDLGESAQPIVAALLSGRPVLIATGHYGNWEMAGYALAMLGFKSYAVARPLDNPYVDDLLRGFRERTGQKLLAKKGELDRMQDILDGGGIVCTLADQDAGQNGLFVDFFGRPASTHKAVAVLALRHETLILVAGMRRAAGPLHYQLHVTDIIDSFDYAAEPHAVRALTQRYTAALERLVRLDPRQYFWLHRRWKHQPKAKAKKAA
jgi:KDO2-lipid IV(A) lauroyltransferase